VAKPRNVAQGMEVAGMTIVYRGLRDRAEVVVDGQSRLNPGSKVTIIRPGSDTARGAKIASEAP